MRVIVAGRYRKVVRYTRALPNDSPRVRSEKKVATNNAKRYINIKTSTEKLQWLLCANYDRKDACFLTFTVRDDQMPQSRADMKARMSAFMQNCRKEFARQGREFKFVYTVEGNTAPSVDAADPSGIPWEIEPWSDKRRWDMVDDVNAKDTHDAPVRIHAHCCLLLNKTDYDTIRSFWSYGHVYINAMRVNHPDTFAKIAAYMMKDVRNGKSPAQERGYIPSLNLEKPTVDGWWCSEFEGIAIPDGAETIERQLLSTNLYGAAEEHAFYRLPRDRQLPGPYKSKGSLNRKVRKRKSK